MFGPERSGRVRCVGRGPAPSKLAKQCTAARFEANNAEVVQMKTKMTSLETQVESLTRIIQQLLSTRSNDSVSYSHLFFLYHVTLIYYSGSQIF